jgi:hypothetical protein
MKRAAALMPGTRPGMTAKKLAHLSCDLVTLPSD